MPDEPRRVDAAGEHVDQETWVYQTGTTGFEINAADQDLARVTGVAWQALLAANAPVSWFRYGGLPCRIECDDDDSLVIRPLTIDRLRGIMARVAKWFVNRRTGDGTLPAKPPLDVIRDMLARPDLPLPVVCRVVEAPVFAADGTFPDAEGYHLASETIYRPATGFTIPAVSLAPTRAELGDAVALIQDDCLGDFPFVGEAERAHAIALFLLPFLRELIDGPTPLHLIEKPSPGTGGTLLAEVLTYPAVGRTVATMTEGRDDEEWRKRVTAKLMGGPSVILIDNLRRRLEASTLAAVITAHVWEDRILGLSEQARLPVRCAWVATGNNPIVSAEIARRTVRIRLDAKSDRPWLREQFRHDDLRGWVAAHRAELVWAALTIGRAWIAAGQPLGTIKLGMFERWSQVLGGVLEVAGIEGFLGNLDEFYEETDIEGRTWATFVEAWWTARTDRESSIADLFPLASSDGVNLDLGTGNDRSQRTRLGLLLTRMRDRQFDGRRIRKAGVAHQAQMWRLEMQESHPGF